MWTYVHDQNKRVDSKVIAVEDRVNALEYNLATTQSELDQVRNDEIKTRDELIYVKSQSMRNNLVFGNIPEVRAEYWAESETKLRDFIVNKLKIAQNIVDDIQFERVHRMGDFYPDSRYPRKLVVKFFSFKDREIVRRQRENLHDTEYFLHEQFPPEISARRRAHMPALKAAKRQGKRTWLSYDRLYIDGKPVYTDQQRGGSEVAGTGSRTGNARTTAT
ncbi:uncharacterized protein LOC128241346 [Mya arenaria]|uniref:uncharacterized protein LOC128241346 n=1 Tax=Mya arenaria TaxID=6604 RepID=UPI0022E3530F|nr:uncharacterized protein LOC128241346 [Mya arenaria]